VTYEPQPLEGIKEAKVEVDEETKEAVKKGDGGCRQS